MFVLTKEDEVRLATGTYHACFDRANKPDGIYIWGCHLGHGNQEWKWDKETGERARLDNAAHAMLCHACAMLCYAIRLRTLRRTLSLVRSTRQPVTSCRVVTLTDCVPTGDGDDGDDGDDVIAGAGHLYDPNTHKCATLITKGGGKYDVGLMSCKNDDESMRWDVKAEAGIE